MYETFHFVGWRLKFYDNTLNDRVSFARHALSIDEARKDFDRVSWNNAEGVHPRKQGEINWFEQVWFAGNHSDIGGSYPENESRLSDIAFEWMVNEARRLPNPLIVDYFYLRLFPSSAGKQHDECKSGVGGLKFLRWQEKSRTVPSGAFLHPSVFERLALDEIQIYGTIQKYDPDQLRGRSDLNCYVPVAPSNPHGAQPKADDDQ